jgi:predicted small metal-binding protein
MKKFRCGDVVPGCSWAVEGSEDEILAAVVPHALHDHGLTDIPDSLVQDVRAAITG